MNIIIKLMQFSKKLVKQKQNQAHANHTSYATMQAMQTMHPCKTNN